MFKKILIVIAASTLLPAAVNACGTRPKPLTAQEITERSDVIVRGALDYAYSADPQQDVSLTGKIVTLDVNKGAPAKSYEIREDSLSLYCQGWGWYPDPYKKLHRYEGTFYLVRMYGGFYQIVKYEP